MSANSTTSEGLRKLAARAKRLAGGSSDETMRRRFEAASAEFEQRAKEVSLDESTGQ
jgi:hypothetical protein